MSKGRELGVDGGAVVSMRCLRHKKRFNVPMWWCKRVSDWLCPRCYERLGAEERGRYSPKAGIDLTLRAAESGKAVVVPTEKQVPPSAEAAEEGSGEPKKKRGGSCKGRKWRKSRVDDGAWKLRLAGVLPTQSVKCLKCGEEAPCHLDWYEKSRVLCPRCYSEMGESEVAEFHRVYAATVLATGVGAGVPPKGVPRAREERTVRVPKCTGIGIGSGMKESEAVHTGGIWTAEHIMRASTRKLKAAIAAGRVSEVRGRMELKRRRNHVYYDMFPDDREVVRMEDPWKNLGLTR